MIGRRALALRGDWARLEAVEVPALGPALTRELRDRLPLPETLDR